MTELLLILAVFCLFFGGAIGWLIGVSVIEKVHSRIVGFLQSDEFFKMDYQDRQAIMRFYWRIWK